MHLEQLLNAKELPARVTLNESTTPVGEPVSGPVSGSPSLGTPYGSTTHPISAQQTPLDVASHSAQHSTTSTAPFLEAHNNTHGLDQSIESRSHPLHQQPRSLKRRRSLSPTPPGLPILPPLLGDPLREPVYHSGVSTESVNRTKRHAEPEARYAPRDERSQTADNLVALKRSEARHVPLGAATGVTSAPRQQNTFNTPSDQRRETIHQYASYPKEFRQGAYIQQDHPEDNMPGYSQQSPLVHAHDSASSSRDSAQATGGNRDHRNTLPPIRTLIETLPPVRTLFESRQTFSTPIGYDPWRRHRQYHHHNNSYGTYYPHIMENRRRVDKADGSEPILVHGNSPTGPPLKPFDPLTTESIALNQQLYVLRKQEAEKYPVAYIY